MMKASSRLQPTLRWIALAVFVAGLGVWLATGAHRGWTQTSVTEQKRDEITGIDYPVRRSAFIAGVEIPSLATLLAGGFLAASLLARREAKS